VTSQNPNPPAGGRQLADPSRKYFYYSSWDKKRSFFMGKENLYRIEGNCARKPRTEVVGSKSFNLAEYHHTITDQEIRTDVEAYLGEYRLEKKRHDYTLVFSKGDEGFRLRDLQREESMRTKAILAVQEKRLLGDPTKREEAELQGIVRLEDQLNFAKDGDHIFWASPPGPKKEGYGDYGFLFAGRVNKGEEKALIKMTAYRIDLRSNRSEKPTIEMFNKALSRLTGEKVSHAEAIDFLVNPRVVRGNRDLQLKESLEKDFSFKVDKNEQKIAEQITNEIKPMVDDFVVIARTGAKEERIKAFNALENYTLKLKRNYRNPQNGNIIYLQNHVPPALRDIINVYGHKAPVVGGSCGSTEQKSNNLLNSSQGVMGRLQKILNGESEEGFVCPKCHFEAPSDTSVGNECPSCHLTKEEYIKQGGKTC